jgi:hypothetical protein
MLLGVWMLAGCSTRNVASRSGLDEQLPPVPVLLGQEHYTLELFQVEHGSSSPGVDFFDIGLCRDIYSDHAEWVYGGWYLISWSPSPSDSREHFRFIGTGSITEEIDPARFDSFAADQVIWDRGRMAASGHFKFSGLRAALGELSQLDYGGEVLTAEREVTLEFSLTLRNGYEATGTAYLHLVRRDGIDPPNYYVDHPLVEPVPVTALPTWDQPDYDIPDGSAD